MKQFLACLLIASSGTLFANNEDAIFFKRIQRIEDAISVDINNASYQLSSIAKDTSTLSSQLKYYLAKVLSKYYFKKGNNEKSLKYLDQCLHTRFYLKDKQEINYLYAKYYFAKQQYDKTIDYLLKALREKKYSNEKNLAKVHTLLGATYASLGEYQQAEKYYKNAYRLFVKLKDQIGLSQVALNIGELKSNEGQHQQSVYYYKKNLKYTSGLQNLDEEIVLSNIGNAFIELGQLDSAAYYTDKALKLSIRLKDNLGELIAINNLATIYNQQKNYQKALEYYLKALAMVDELGFKEEKKMILLNLSQLYERRGDISKSFSFYKAYTKIKEELFNSEKAKFIFDAQEKYEATKRKREIAELKLKQQANEAKHTRFVFRTIIFSVILGFILLLIYIWFRWRSLHLKNKNKLAIISATMEAEENERLRISQELHDDLGGILGMSRMLFTKAKSYIIHENQELYRRIDDLLVHANNRSRTISHELYSPTLKQFGLEPALKEYIENIRSVHSDLLLFFVMKNIRLDQQLELNLFRISQELLTNTLKHAHAQEIRLTIEVLENKLTYTYFDNGVGFDDQSVKIGVGLNSLTSRVERYKGHLSIQTAKNKGFKVIITIPL